jgi:hypothetical protein
MIQQEQVDEIMAFCKAKGVTYYDIQVELVDHIADSIEDLQKSNPTLPFSDALDIAGKQFDNEEFAEIVKSKKRSIEKKMSRSIEKEFLSFFTVPRIMITMLLIVVALTSPYFISGQYRFIPIILILFIVLYITLIHAKPIEIEIRSIKEACQIPLLSLDVQSRYERFLRVIGFLYYLSHAIYFFFYASDETHKITDPTPQKILILQLVLVVYTIICILYLSSIYVRQKAYNKIFDQYTKAFISE